jgi:signal transduction histidine kinase
MTGARRSGLRWATVAVVVVIAAIAILGALLTRHSARSEEHKLLGERASEIGLILTDAFTSLQTQMATTASETALGGATGPAFKKAAQSLFLPQPGASTALAKSAGETGPVRFVAVQGSLPRTPTEGQTALIHHALTVQPAAVTSAVSGTGTSKVLGLAYPVGVDNLVIYRELPLNPEQAGSATAQGQPFNELAVALYAGPRRAPNLLVLTTSPGGTVPLNGTVATAKTAFGADTWLVAIKANSPLIGKFATNAYWIVLAGGLILAIVLGVLADALLRRRDYAMTLVGERTEELRQSLVKLEDAQDRLLRQERLAAIGELASAVGHELRNPLGVITNAHYLLRTQLEQQGANGGLRHLSTAEREVGAATLIVSDLLDFSRAREPVATAVDVSDLVTEIESVLPPPNNVTIQREDASGLPPVLADRDQLRQVLLNLMSNAYEAMPDGGTVTITLAESGGQVRIAVVDTGAGMDEETESRVFEPFFTRKARGIGLGLAVTKRIVDSHNATISVVSAPGQGSTFTIDFPVAVVEPAP